MPVGAPGLLHRPDDAIVVDVFGQVGELVRAIELPVGRRDVSPFIG